MKTTAILSTLIALALAAPAPYDVLSKRQGQNFQTFTGALGGITATPITDSGNPDRKFAVKDDTFVNLGAALQRSCDQQFNACANKANGGDQTLSVSACAGQKTQCDAAGQGNTGASSNQAVASSTAAATTNAAAAAAASSTSAAAHNPCNTAAANSGSKASATATAAAAAASTNAAAAKNPCNTAAASADSNTGNANQSKDNASKNDGNGNKGAQVAANPCNQKRHHTSGNKRSMAAKRIARRFKVA